jgi:uncharacterized protein (DUF3820 family)
MKNWQNVYAYTRISFGAYRGKYLKDIPDDYLNWGVLNMKDRDTAQMFKIELQRRHEKSHELTSLNK